MEDSYRHKGMRRKMLEELRQRGISDERVLKAMDQIPRHWFLDEAFLKHAYEHQAFQIGCKQTISHPYTVAFQSQVLDVEPGNKVLEIGTGCGYQTAVLVKLGGKVFSVERQRPLFLKTKKLLQKIGARAETFYGDGYKGLPQFGPFDRIIVTAGAPYVPEPLKEQLKVGGVLVIPVGEKKQIMQHITRLSEKDYHTESLGDFAFVPMLEDKNWKEA